jgi:membrane protease YdiL (CAAX protease family)
MEESLGTWLALLISALIFGLMHIANPNATLWSALAIAIEAGIMLAAAYTLTRRLWLPIGIHFAWNFVQGGIFGVAVSGNGVRGLLQSTLSGPALLSGGEFGAEASIFAVIVCLAAGVYLIQAAWKKGNILKPFWTR